MPDQELLDGAIRKWRRETRRKKEDERRRRNKEEAMEDH